MDLSFDRGDPRSPRGHAVAYFRLLAEPVKVYATYIIVLPISIDFSKYVPPFLASHLGNVSLGDLSAFSLPPVPEEVSSYQELEGLASSREDDLIFGGTMNSFDLPEMMEAVGELVRQYAQLWTDRPGALVPTAGTAESEEGQVGVNEVLYSLMNERDRLADLAKLVGRLRFAVEGNDRQTGGEVEEEINILGKFLPESYWVPALLQAVMDSSSKGARMAKLYMDRCYRLNEGDQDGARDLERVLESLRDSP